MPIDHEQNMLRAVLQLEDRLLEPPSMEELAATAGLSVFHFHRLFREYTGEPPAGYAQRLRLELAASWLISTDRPAVEIASAVGYASREGFVRAFSRLMRVSPEVFRAKAIQRRQRHVKRLRRFPPLDVRIIHRVPLKVAVLRSHADTFSIIRNWWRMLKVIRDWNECEPQHFVGITHDDDLINPPRRQRYDAAVAIPSEIDLPSPLVSTTLPGGQFAVVDFCGSVNQLIDAWNWLGYVWLPDHGWHLRDRRCFDIYASDQLPSNWPALLRLAASRTFRTRMCVPLQPYLSPTLP